MLGWACSSEGKERSRDKGQGGSQETKGCREGGEEEENIRISPTTLKQDANLYKRYVSIGQYCLVHYLK